MIRGKVKETESVVFNEKERKLIENAVYFDIARSTELIERMDGKMHSSAKAFLAQKINDLKALHKKLVSGSEY